MISGRVQELTAQEGGPPGPLLGLLGHPAGGPPPWGTAQKPGVSPRWPSGEQLSLGRNPTDEATAAPGKSEDRPAEPCPAPGPHAVLVVHCLQPPEFRYLVTMTPSSLAQASASRTTSWKAPGSTASSPCSSRRAGKGSAPPWASAETVLRPASPLLCSAVPPLPCRTSVL